jgi:DNA-binding IclR family transcriptional regulator
MARTTNTQNVNANRVRTYSAPALEKGFDIIELLATEPEGLTISEMATRLGRSISEIFRMIIVMERRFWLSKDPDTDRYRVTYKVLDLAYRATPAQELVRVAGPVMASLAQQTQQSCHLVVQYGNRALIVLRQESPGAVGFAVRLGTAVDLVASSSGHVLLAFMEGQQFEQILGELNFPPGVDASSLRGIVKRVRKRGYETTASARVAGVRDISYPIFGFTGHVAAALTIPFVTFIDGSQHVDFEAAREMLADAAGEISRGLGWAAHEQADFAG